MREGEPNRKRADPAVVVTLVLLAAAEAAVLAFAIYSALWGAK